MEDKVIHQTINGKYRICFEQAASTKGVIGFKVEANGDEIDLVKVEATLLLEYAKAHAPNNTTEAK